MAAPQMINRDEHVWVGPCERAWHCYGCGETLQFTKDPLPQYGCKPLRERVLAILENPGRWTRKAIAAVLRESIDRPIHRHAHDLYSALEKSARVHANWPEFHGSVLALEIEAALRKARGEGV